MGTNMTLSIKKVNKTRPWALKVSYTMICYFYLQTTVAFAVFRLMSCFVVYRRVRGKTENMKVYGRACVFIVCFMYRSWWLCSFPTQWERVRQVLYKLLDSKLLWKQSKHSGGNSVDYRLHLPLAIYLQCAMKWVFVYYTTLNCQRRVLFSFTPSDWRTAR